MATIPKAPTTDFISTTLNGSINDTTTTITVNDASAIQVPTYIVVDREDANGNPTPSAREVMYVSAKVGNTLTVTRGVNNSTAKSHNDGALVEPLLTVGFWSDFYTAITTEHNSDGTHKTITLDEQSSTPATPASGKSVVYIKSDGYLYYVDDTGTERRYYPPVVDNNVAYQLKDSSGTARNFGKVNTSDMLEIGDSGLSGQIDFKQVWKSSVQPACKLRKSVAQSIPNATWTSITWDTEDFDQGGLHSTASNTERITIPTGGDGTYLVIGQIRIAVNATGFRSVRILKNGVASNSFFCYSSIEANVVDADVTIIKFIGFGKLVAGDYIEIQVYQNSGGALNVQVASDSTDTGVGVIKLT